MSKTFKSFREEISTESEDKWEHGEDYIEPTGGGVSLYKNLEKRKKGQTGAHLNFQPGSKSKPYYIEHWGTDNHNKDIRNFDPHHFSWHDNLKSALAKLKEHGTEVPKEHVRKFKERALRSASSTVDDDIRNALLDKHY